MRSSYLTVTDLFCGAGGSSQGAADAGSAIRIRMAVNHWALAVESHNTNFPDTDHDCADISAVDPRRYPSTTILLASPECTNHSQAKGKRLRQDYTLFGGKPDPAEERSRATMWDVPRFAEFHEYEVVIVENVVEARKWRPFEAWLQAMRLLEYEHEVVYFNSMFAHPTPQSRDRMYVVFWKRGNRKPDLDIRPKAYCERCGHNVGAVQSWKGRRRWGRYGARGQYVYRCPECAQVVTPFYYCAANAIEWQRPIPRVGERARPLKEKTLARIRRGLEMFSRPESLAEKLGPHPFLVETAFAGRERRARSVLEVGFAQTSKQSHALVVPPFVVEFWGQSVARGVYDPLAAVTAGGNHHGLCVPPFLMSYYGSDCFKGMAEPAGTMTGKDRHALVLPDETAQVEQCGFRMLEPSEIGKAMAFPQQYVVLGNKRERVRQYGQAVTPPVMRELVRRCVATLA